MRCRLPPEELFQWLAQYCNTGVVPPDEHMQRNVNDFLNSCKSIADTVKHFGAAAVVVPEEQHLIIQVLVLIRILPTSH